MNSKSLKERIIKDTAKYSIAQYASQGIGFVTAIFLRRFLTPYYMGIWSLLTVVQNYLGYLTLGVNSAAIYRIPFYRGKNDKASEEETRDTAFSFLFLASLFSCLCLVVAVLFLRNKYPPEVIIGLLALAIYIILQRAYSFYVVVLRAYSDFSVLAKSLLFDAVCNLILTVLIIRQFKIYGLYATVSILAVLNTLFVHTLAKRRINFKFNLKRLGGLILYGFPILLNGVLVVILRTIDRIMIGKMLGVTFVGYYSIATMPKSYVHGLSNNFYIVTIPHMQESYGKKENAADIKKFVAIPIEAISYFITPVLGLIYLVSPILVKQLLPNYLPGLFALQILLLDTFFSTCSAQASQFLITLNKQTRLVLISVIAILVNIALNYAFIKNGLGINGVALGGSIASLFIFLATIIYAMGHFFKGKDIIIYIIKIIFPLIYILAIIYGCLFIRAGNLYVELVLRLTLFCAASLPLFIYADKKTHALRMVFAMIKNKFNKNG